MTQTVTLQIPEPLYQRLVNTARATNRPLEEIMLYAPAIAMSWRRRMIQVKYGLWRSERKRQD
ncbi:MAG: hypothetical protein AB1589_27780 [Cyanobacteriota bacterium]